ncbi:hypothetical protein [Rhizobium mesoamericanum]|uniref:hypothetical protein n=1 Tax=Rhizobium mesoamericanum TaxID=1079800 RepID=UPI002E1F24ED
MGSAKRALAALSELSARGARLTISQSLYRVASRKNEVKPLDRNDFPVHVEGPVNLGAAGIPSVYPPAWHVF